MGRYAMEHAFHADIFINIRPAYSLPIADEFKVYPLRWRRLRQPPGPCKRHTDDAAVH